MFERERANEKSELQNIYLTSLRPIRRLFANTFRTFFILPPHPLGAHTTYSSFSDNLTKREKGSKRTKREKEKSGDSFKAISVGGGGGWRRRAKKIG